MSMEHDKHCAILRCFLAGAGITDLAIVLGVDRLELESLIRRAHAPQPAVVAPTPAATPRTKPTRSKTPTRRRQVDTTDTKAWIMSRLRAAKDGLSPKALKRSPQHDPRYALKQLEAEGLVVATSTTSNRTYRLANAQTTRPSGVNGERRAAEPEVEVVWNGARR